MLDSGRCMTTADGIPRGTRGRKQLPEEVDAYVRIEARSPASENVHREIIEALGKRQVRRVRGR